MIKKIINLLTWQLRMHPWFKSKKFWFGISIFFLICAIISPFIIRAQEDGELPDYELPLDLECTWWKPSTYFNCFLVVILKVLSWFIFLIPLIIGMLIFWLMSVILQWVLGPYFISVPFTNNVVVNAGLSITRPLANMAFLIFLLIIAVATALRIEEYKAKKTLPILIIIALLINFSPVFCGIVIDASNVVMWKFTSEITGYKSLVTTAWSVGETIADMFFAGWGSLRHAAFTFFQALVVTVFLWFASFVYATYCLLFATRYIMLWILVILSPIAFAAYILPATRRGNSLLNWSEWWKQFVQWCIIGIVGAFFIYLGFVMLEVIHDTVGKAPIVGFGVMNEILPTLIPLILLYIAYKELKKTSAMFAQQIIQMPNRFGKALQTVAITAATAGAGAVGAVAGPALTKAQARIMGRLERVPLLGQAVGGPGATKLRLKRKTEKAAKGLTDETDDLHVIVQSRYEDMHRRVAAFEKLADKGKLTNVDIAKLKPTDYEFYGGDMGKFLQARPGLSPETRDPSTGERRTVRKTVERQTPGKFRNKVQSEALKNPEVFVSLDLRKIRDLERRGSTEQKEAIRELIQTNRQTIGDAIRAIHREMNAATDPNKKRQHYAEWRRAREVYVHAIRSPVLNPKGP